MTRITGRANLFAYGTLELPEVMERVSGVRHASREVVLEGYARFLLKGRTYPGIVRTAGARTRGVLYLDVGAAAWARLDRFEDEVYERQAVIVVGDSGGRHEAFAYVVPRSMRHRLGSDPWDREAFRRLHLDAFRAERPALRSD